ncbi:MAG: acyltransferase family protein [Verrucomicrobia bacterium]|nr:acyltransferase family protein [Verrucomicrobiota bacterium]
MKRNEFLDFAKGILIILVPVGHALQYAVYQNQDFFSDPFFKAIYMFHMPLFMGIAGFLSHAGMEKNPPGKFMRARAQTYLVPILAWAVLYQVILFICLGGHGWSAFPKAFVREFLSGLWFLWALVGCLAMTAAARAFGRYFWAVYALMFCGILFLPDTGILYLFKYMVPYFQAGYLLAALGGFTMKGTRAFGLFAVAGGLTAGCYLLWNDNTYIYTSKMALVRGNYGNIGLRYLSGFAASVLALFIIRYLYLKTPESVNRFVRALGRDSIYIYILQYHLFVVLALLATRYFPPFGGSLSGVAFACLAGLLIASGCWLAGKMLAGNEWLAAVLFGKIKKPGQPPQPAVLAVAPHGDAEGV